MRESHIVSALVILATVVTLQLAQGQRQGQGERFDHSAQHCHDVSVWGEVQYRDEDCEKCETKFEKMCETKTENVCEMVPNTKCELIAFTDCNMISEETEYNETSLEPDELYVPWQCSNFTTEEIHIKLVPKCENVTRMDCVTKWVLTETGEKVWDGNELCRPVSWMNCSLHEVPKPFNQTYTRCSRTGVPIPTTQCILTTKTRMTSRMQCQIKTAVHCNCTHEEQCKDVTFQECREEPSPLRCVTDRIKVPYQPKIHRVKCLLASDQDSPQLDVDESARLANRELRFDLSPEVDSDA